MDAEKLRIAIECLQEDRARTETRHQAEKARYFSEIEQIDNFIGRYQSELQSITSVVAVQSAIFPPSTGYSGYGSLHPHEFYSSPFPDGYQQIVGSVRKIFPEEDRGGIIPDFPKDAPYERQILFYLRHFRRPLKIAELENGIEENGNERPIELGRSVRKLQREGYIRLLKINDSNKLSFWILPEWVNPEDNTLRDEFKTRRFQLLYAEDTIEIQ
jgi:hypothetical protein